MADAEQPLLPPVLRLALRSRCGLRARAPGGPGPVAEVHGLGCAGDAPRRAAQVFHQPHAGAPGHRDGCARRPALLHGLLEAVAHRRDRRGHRARGRSAACRDARERVEHRHPGPDAGWRPAVLPRRRRRRPPDPLAHGRHARRLDHAPAPGHAVRSGARPAHRGRAQALLRHRRLEPGPGRERRHARRHADPGGRVRPDAAGGVRGRALVLAPGGQSVGLAALAQRRHGARLAAVPRVLLHRAHVPAVGGLQALLRRR